MVANGRRYNLNDLDESERPMDDFSHSKAWVTYAQTKANHSWTDRDFAFPPLSKILKSILKTNATTTGCENARVEWGKKCQNRPFLSCSIVRYEIS